jgi:hypothetical protein
VTLSRVGTGEATRTTAKLLVSDQHVMVSQWLMPAKTSI